MKNWIKIFLPLSVILFGIFIAQNVVQNKQNKVARSGYQKIISGIDAASINKIIISNGVGTITLQKKDTNWDLDGKKADSALIGNVISILLDKDGVNYDLVSSNPGRFNDLNISNSSPTVSLLSATNEIFSVIVGNSNYAGSYIRPKSENKVYLTNKSLNITATTSRQDIYEKTVLSLPRARIQKIYVDTSKEKYSISKTEGHWKMILPVKPIDETKVEEFVTSLENFRAETVIESRDQKNAYRTSYGSISLQSDDAKSETLTITKGKDDFMVTRTSDGQSYTVSRLAVENILKPSKYYL